MQAWFRDWPLSCPRSIADLWLNGQKKKNLDNASVNRKELCQQKFGSESGQITARNRGKFHLLVVCTLFHWYQFPVVLLPEI